MNANDIWDYLNSMRGTTQPHTDDDGGVTCTYRKGHLLPVTIQIYQDDYEPVLRWTACVLRDGSGFLPGDVAFDTLDELDAILPGMLRWATVIATLRDMASQAGSSNPKNTLCLPVDGGMELAFKGPRGLTTLGAAFTGQRFWSRQAGKSIHSVWPNTAACLGRNGKRGPHLPLAA